MNDVLESKRSNRGADTIGIGMVVHNTLVLLVDNTEAAISRRKKKIGLDAPEPEFI